LPKKEENAAVPYSVGAQQNSELREIMFLTLYIPWIIIKSNHEIIKFFWNRTALLNAVNTSPLDLI